MPASQLASKEACNKCRFCVAMRLNYPRTYSNATQGLGAKHPSSVDPESPSSQNSSSPQMEFAKLPLTTKTTIVEACYYKALKKNVEGAYKNHGFGRQC